MIILMGLWNVV